MIDPACKSASYDLSAGANFEGRLQRCLVAGVATLICIGGLIGNSLTVMSVILSKEMKSFTHAFVANLAVADLLSSILMGFYVQNLLWNDDDQLPLPCPLCKAIGVLSFITFSSTVVNIAFIAFNRYYRITRPLNKYVNLFNKNRITFMLATPWVYSILVPALGETLGTTTFGYNVKYKICLVHFEDSHVGMLTFVRLFLIDGLCILVMLYCYAMIFCHTRRQNKQLLKLFPPNTVRLKSEDGGNTVPVVTTSEKDERFETKNISVVEEKEKHRKCVDGVIKEYATVTMEITETYRIQKKLETTISVENEDRNRMSLTMSEDKTIKSVKDAQFVTSADVTENGVERLQEEQPTYYTNDDDSDAFQTEDNKTHFSSEDEEEEKEENEEIGHSRSKKYKKRTTNRGRKFIRTTVNKRQSALTMNLLLVGVTFLVCTIPYLVCVGIEMFQEFLPYITLLYVSKACVNPLIYAFKDPRFRKAFCHIIRLQFSKVK